MTVIQIWSGSVHFVEECTAVDPYQLENMEVLHNTMETQLQLGGIRHESIRLTLAPDWPRTATERNRTGFGMVRFLIARFFFRSSSSFV